VTVIYCIVGYIISAFLTFFVQRLYLKRSYMPDAEPLGLLVFLILLPIVGLFVSLWMLIDVLIGADKGKTVYRRFYRL
jgi:hypothetical protein